ncbi:hypothetical protein TKK_0014810 [Trichogramma kaykai]|uniref:HTH psq-type domain-containing protein n=1 Tax=Trichogramma kaykai TaxID=54128 RepID=A0ABD2WCH7_9HYME
MVKSARRIRVSYTQENLEKAITAVKAGASVNEASRKYRIPRSTLYIKVYSTLDIHKPGSTPLLSQEDEKKLIKWFDYMFTLERPVTKDHLINSVALLAKLSKKNIYNAGRPCDYWCECFYRRHGNLKEKMQKSAVKSKCEPNKITLMRWFDRILNQLHVMNLTDIDPTRVFNIGETILPLNPKSSQINRIYERKGLVLIAGNVVGHMVPPMILLDFESTDDLTKSPQNWVIRQSHGAWLDSEIFKEYIQDIFYPWLVKNNTQFPVILYLDSHVQFLTQPLTEFFQNRQITVFVLPYNTTEFLQPLDIGLFKFIEQFWEKIVHIFKIENKMDYVRPIDFILLLKELFDNISIDELMSESFQKSGLYPLSDIVIENTNLSLQKDEKEDDERIHRSSSSNTLLKSIEKLIDPLTLSTFRCLLNVDKWEGNPADENLFYLWRKVYNKNKTGSHCSKNTNLNAEENCLSSRELSFNEDIFDLPLRSADMPQNEQHTSFEENIEIRDVNTISETCDVEEFISPINVIVANSNDSLTLDPIEFNYPELL